MYIYTKRSVKDFLLRENQRREVRNGILARVDAVSQGNEFPGSKTFLVFKNPSLAKDFTEWVAKLHPVPGLVGPRHVVMGCQRGTTTASLQVDEPVLYGELCFK